MLCGLECPLSDDIYLINEAKTIFREAFNNGDVDQLLSVFHDSVVEMSDGELSGFAAGAHTKMCDRATILFAEYRVKMVPIVIDIAVNGSSAYDFGWHEITLTPKAGGQPIYQRVRYLEHWKKSAAGQWKISFFMSNTDVKETFNGMEARWFIGEDTATVY
jgi:ketosteroid isomerase-like protein